MSGLFGSSNAQSSPGPLSALNIQQSTYSTPIEIVYGTNRVAGNLIWYGGFNETQTSTGGGKGGMSGGGGKGGGSSEYNYSASFQLGIVEGPVAGIGNVWVTKQITNLPGAGGTLYAGNLNQGPSGYLISNFPAYALGYSTLAYADFPNFSLGTSPELPQFSFEVSGLLVIGGGNQDAYADQVLIDFLKRAGFPTAMIDTFTAAATYWKAMGFFISPLLDQQRQANDWMNEWMATLNAEFVFTNGVLTIVPRGDSTVSANGVTYVPNLTPIYSIGDDDYIVDGDEDPVTVSRPDLQDAYNQMPIEYYNRSDQYNLETFTAEDAGQVDQFSYRIAPTLTAHHITNPVVAQSMAYIALWKQLYIDHGPQYEFKLPWNYILLDPMDLISITDSNLGLNNTLVRVKSIKENADGELQFTCEGMPGDLSLPATYNMVAPVKYAANYNVDPGDVNTPIFYEAPLALMQTTELQIYLAVSSSNPEWGGCNVWISNDGETYKYLTQVNGSSRMGVLTAPLKSYTPTAGGNAIDQSDTLSISMAESLGVLNNSATNNDATTFNTLSYVDGELIAFGSDILTGPNRYNLTYLNRGCYGSTINPHATGTNFFRIDNSVSNFTVDQSRIGQILYFKFLSFNSWGGGLQNLADVPAYEYNVMGTALLTALAPVTGVSVSYTDNIAILNWTGISDLRAPITYQIRKGTNFTSSQIIGYTTKTTYEVWGTDTYWISAYYQTPLGIGVYSAPQVSIMVTTPNLAQNVIQTYDEAATGWSGSVSGAATLTGGNIVVGGPGDIISDPDIITTPDVITYGTGLPPSQVGDILSDPDIITTPDILLFGGTTIAASGTYTIPTAHEISTASVVRANVTCNWRVDGFNALTDDIILQADILSVQDILNGALEASVYAQPQIQLSQDGTTFGQWQNWIPGTYEFKKINFRINIYTLSSQVQAILSDFSYSVDIPQTVFTGSVRTSTVAATAVTFPGSYVYNVDPIISPTIVSAQAGDICVLTSVTTSGFTVEVLNSGSRVVRTVSWTSTGY